jgi:hypothetical protein
VSKRIGLALHHDVYGHFEHEEHANGRLLALSRMMGLEVLV